MGEDHHIASAGHRDIAEQDQQAQGAHQSAGKDPWLELTPAGVGVVDDDAGDGVVEGVQDPQYREDAAHQGQHDHAVGILETFGIEGLVIIGGDGSLHGGLELDSRGITVMGVPGTIDNDLAYTDYTIGFDTACNTAIECIDKLRDTMQSHERCSVVEVMGRHAGYLALYVGIAVGATAVLIPERDVDFEKDVVERIRESRLAGNTHFMIVVAEGAGSAVEIGKRIQETVGIDPRVTVLGHIQRGGSPTARDRETASRMGYAAVKALAEGRMNCIVGTNEGHLVEIPIEKALNMTKHLQMERYEVLEAMHNQVPLKCGPIQ